MKKVQPIKLMAWQGICQQKDTRANQSASLLETSVKSTQPRSDRQIGIFSLEPLVFIVIHTH